MLATLIYGIINGLLISLLALAFQINFKIYKIFDLSQAGIYVCVSYFFITLFKSSLKTFSDSYSTVFILVLVTCCFSWTLSLIIFNLVYKKFFLKDSSSLSLMIVSIAIYMITINIITIIYGPETQIINIKKLPFNDIQFSSVVLTRIQLLQFTISSIILLLTLFVLKNKKIGKEINALSENKELFITLGYNVNKTRMNALMISSSLIAIVSILKTLEYGIEPYNMGFQSILIAVVAVLIGGVNSFKGALLGGIFIGILNSIGVWFFSGEWQETITHIVLLSVLIFKKDGFFSKNLRLEK